jgi:drug/metabolite transporter (DMT)-like permease
MQSRVLTANLLLLLTALIWGTSFVAQRVGMETLGPFAYNAARFALAALVLAPFVLRRKRKAPPSSQAQRASRGLIIAGWVIAGTVLFLGATFQQIGLVYTTAGKAGFITGLYVVIVPFLGLFVRQAPTLGGGIGAAVAAIGLYFLSITEDFTISTGDAWTLIGAGAWATHVLILGWLSPKLDCIKLACAQAFVCMLLSLGAAVIFETTTLEALRQTAIPIFYGGVISVGIAYTLQVVAQKNAPATHAAVILSLESVFAALAGWALLNELMTDRALLGCALMLAGMLTCQLWPKGKRRKA